MYNFIFEEVEKEIKSQKNKEMPPVTLSFEMLKNIKLTSEKEGFQKAINALRYVSFFQNSETYSDWLQSRKKHIFK